MTNQKENRVVDNYNAVFVRSEADLNRCSSFCRAVPSHSAIRPCMAVGSGDPPFPCAASRETALRCVWDCKYTHFSEFRKI